MLGRRAPKQANDGFAWLYGGPWQFIV